MESHEEKKKEISRENSDGRVNEERGTTRNEEEEILMGQLEGYYEDVQRGNGEREERGKVTMENERSRWNYSPQGRESLTPLPLPLSLRKRRKRRV